MTIIQAYSVIGVLLGLLIGILTYLAKVVMTLNDTVIALKTLEPERSMQCNSKHSTINNKLQKIEDILQNHEIRVVTIENKLNLD